MIITLRSALPSDEKDLSLLYTESRRETFTWCDPSIFQEEDYSRETKGEIVDVACDRGKIVGFVSVWELDDFIHHLYVHRDYQRQGVGSLLLARALRHCKSGKARLKCLIRNKPARAFYLKEGWMIVENGRDSLGEFHLMELKTGTASAYLF